MFPLQFTRRPAIVFRQCASHTRWYAEVPAAKASVKLIAELRKITDVSIAKAKEALVATNNNVDAALQWLEKDLAVSGAKKADKVRGRIAKEGLISVSILSRGAEGGHDAMNPVRAAMIELNCETDFVGRNKLFSELARDIAYTAAFFADPATQKPILQPQPLDILLNAPLMSQSRADAENLSVQEAIRNTVVHVGENISLRRSVTTALDATMTSSPSTINAFRLASYVHGSMSGSLQGRVGALAYIRLQATNLKTIFDSPVFREDLGRLERSLLRQIVGFDTRRLTNTGQETEADQALYSQPFATLSGGPSDEKVEQSLRNWAKERGADKLDVVDFAKWTLGEELDDQ